MLTRTSCAAALAAVVLTMPLTARDAIDAFQARYTKLTSVACSFRDASGVRGSIKARRGGLYNIRLTDRTIVCDGKTVWNVMPFTKTVVMNTYKATSEDVSLERVFFLMLNIYRPTLISTSKKASTIRLTAPREDAVIANIHQVDIILDRKNVITSVSINEYGTTTTWHLSKLVLNRSMPASTFTYSVPVGWQTVDLR